MSIFDVRKEEIYLDNAATTEVAREVVEEMQAYAEERYGNPETPYRLGREARSAVEEAREKVAALMGADPEEVFFTSGGTEANNWAVKCAVLGKRKYQLCSAVEHSSVHEAMGHPSNGSFRMDDIPVDEHGMVVMDDLRYVFKEHNDVGLVSVQFGNNEVGTLQPVKEIAALCRENGVTFHCDAVQAYGKTVVDVKALGLDLMTVSAHKIHGPMGVGALYIRKGVGIEPLLHGGDHESGMRAGTQAVAQIVGFGKAVELAAVNLPQDEMRMRSYVDSMAGDLCQKIDAVRNGHPTNRLPHILSVRIPGMESSLLAGIMADVHDCCVGTGSACGARRKESHVLNAMGVSHVDGNSTLRISLSRYTTKTELVMFVAKIQSAVNEAARRDIL